LGLLVLVSYYKTFFFSFLYPETNSSEDFDEEAKKNKEEERESV
jgi:hypothetical protein